MFKVSLFTTLIFVFILGFQILQAQENVEVLEGIQNRIDEAFGASFYAGTDELENIIQDLETAQQNSDNLYLTYWKAYTQYYLTIFYLKGGDNEQVNTFLEAGMESLESLENLDSEGYALLGSLYSLSINMHPSKAANLSAKAKKQYDKAIELDENNLRAYMSIGKSDFYKPVQYGGGKIVEENLLKALTLEDTYSDLPYAPTWGRNQAYAYLVEFYIREDRLQDANLYCQQGLQKFPNDYLLNAHQKELNQ